MIETFIQHPTHYSATLNDYPPLFHRGPEWLTPMSYSILLFLESSTLLLLSSLLLLSYALRHAPAGFQHLHLFYYGTSPEGMIPLESPESAAPTASAGF